MRVLVTGGTGKLGRALRRYLPEAYFPGRSDLDICSRHEVTACLRGFMPDVVIHAAAMTDVRGAEERPSDCYDTNVGGTQNIVEEVSRLGKPCRLVYISSACVFSGEIGNYAEDDSPAPCNVYGWSKLLAENRVRGLAQHLIVRTNFVEKGPWPWPRAFVDRMGTYLYADDVAVQLGKLLRQQMQGTVHVAGDRKLSMYELATWFSPDVGKLRMSEVGSVPLACDMTLVSKRWPATLLDSARHEFAMECWRYPRPRVEPVLYDGISA